MSSSATTSQEQTQKKTLQRADSEDQGVLINKILRILTTPAGRDKLCRLVQYFLLMLIPLLSQYSGIVIPQLEIVRSHMSFLRMAMRFEKPYPMMRGIARRHNSIHRYEPLAILRSIGDAFLVLYFLTDHPMFFHRLGYLTYSAKFADDLDLVNNLFWLANCVIEMIVDSLEIVFMQQWQTRKIMDFLVNVSDLPIIFFFLNFSDFGPVLAGLCGTFASLSVLWRI
ncbi:hypothetical protein FGO68_gene16851 [Halteria grandinella]|uniref:Uncharacterized protein n=1 Tax=Halteria grandinella TaxID=5974 RepID=A0A8J8SZ72_HALGN|nr:hypothetical protein FGO68_gene16851 [Halteria grandinella]